MGTDDRTGQIIQGRYRLLRRVGEGSQGKVYLAEDLARAGEVVALKLVEELVGGRRDSSADHVLRWFRHPNWATVLDVGTWGDSGWFEVTRFVHGTSLAALEGAQPESLVAAFLEQGVRVLGALHRRGLIHYDVTPGNWMLEWHDGEPHFVLTDGGLAHLGAVRGFGRGTPRYMAPEMTQEGEHDHRVDLYSLGLVAFRLATGREPIEGRAGEVLSRRRKERAPRLREIDPEAPVWAEGVIASLLARDPNHRPHDGLAVLRILEQARGTPLPMFTTSEAAEATRGGRMIGNTDAVARIEALVQTLASGALAGGEVPAPTKTLAPVLVVRGPTDSGSTRLAGVALDAARAIDQAAVVLEGDAYRDAALRPFRDLTTGVRLILEPNEDSTSMLPAESVDAAVEHLVAVIEAATEPRSLLFVIRSFESLSVDARAGIQALARYLQARWTSQSNTTARIAMVIDLGESDATLLTLPDRKATTLAEVAPQLLDAARIRDFVADRMPGLVLDDADCRSLAEATEGLPGRLSDLLSQGCARGDVKRVGEAWAWDVSQLSNYRERHEASPAECRLIDQLSPSALHTAGVLALFPSGLPADTAVLAAKGSPGQDLPFAHLTRRHEVAGATFVRLHSDRVRDEVLRRFDAETILQLKQSAYETLQAEAARLRVLDRARTLAMLGDTGAAVELIARGHQEMEPEDAYAGRVLMAECLESEPALLSIGELVTALPQTLGADAPSMRIGRRVVDAASSGSVPRNGQALVLLVRLEAAASYPAAAEFIQHVAEHGGADCDQVAWLAACSRIHFARRDVPNAQRALTSALRLIRRSASDRRPSETAQLLALRAHRHLLLGRRLVALSLMRRARCKATGHVGPAELARLLNNLGILECETGNYAESSACLALALEQRWALLDLRGAVATGYNLARTQIALGRTAEASSQLQRAAALALRHALHEPLAAVLKLLGDLYDSQLNSALAIESLERSIAVADQTRSLYRAASAAWSLAPLAAATGQERIARSALVRSARLARSGTLEQARHLHRVARATYYIHAGLHTRALPYARALQRSMSAEWDTELKVSAALCAMAAGLPAVRSVPGGRPPPVEVRRRVAYRSWVRLARLARGHTSAGLDALVSRQVPTPGSRIGSGAAIRRLVWETAMSLSVSDRSPSRADLHSMIARYAKHAGERFLAARSLCARALVGARALADRSRDFSDAVTVLGELAEGGAPSGRQLPTEFCLAHESLELRRGGRRHPERLEDLQALAHRLLATFGKVTDVDERMTRALRQVLQASAKLDATGDVQALLRSVTELTIDITGAERALVVRPREDGTHETTIALNAAAQSRTADEGVSETVVRRALALRRPLILHDVYGDEELMQRPSITRLALRSIICAPMLRRGQFFGVVYADHASAAGSFDQTDLEVLSLFADQVAGTLEARSLLQDLQGSLDDLREAQDRLVRGERLRTLGELSSGVAHEFNNLLTGILARAQLLRLDSHNVSVGKEASLIERAAEDAAEIIRRLQSFSQKQRERGFGRVGVDAVCEDAVEFLRPLWAPSGVYPRAAVRLICESNIFTRGNPTELREVVTNLLKNALDAAPEGEVVIRARREWPHVLIEVTDTGCGIPPDVEARIFDAFFTTKGTRGTGLGLPLAAQIVERHSGTITVRTAVGSGTSMLVTLPDAGASEQGASPASPATEGVELPPLRIVVVDDDDNVREPLRRYLEHAGHSVTTACDGEQALQLLTGGEAPDLVITDVCMPKLDGVEFCKRALVAHPTLRVVLMTGRTSRIDDVQLRTSGARSVIPKPFAMQTIDAVIREQSGPGQ
jgi:signal transduction histidine kinase/CheY-like chemotaxis protein/tetratricopeptide (TPR) repeat protein